MRVVLAAVGFLAGVDRERVWEVFAIGQAADELARHLDLFVELETPRQGEITGDEQPPVLPLVQVSRVPILAGIVLGPRWHVSGFDVDRSIKCGRIEGVLTCDVVVRADGAGATPARAGPERHVIEAASLRGSATAR